MLVTAHKTAPPRSLPVRGAWVEMREKQLKNIARASLPVRGAWVEMLLTWLCFPAETASLPVRGAWVEIHCATEISFAGSRRSPCGERGLKFPLTHVAVPELLVAPRAGSVG